MCVPEYSQCLLHSCLAKDKGTAHLEPQKKLLGKKTGRYFGENQETKMIYMEALSGCICNEVHVIICVCPCV